MTRRRTLVLFLRVSAFVLLLASAAVVLPDAWMEALHAWLGFGAWPVGPIVPYLARSASALYALLGALYLYLSVDPGRYLELLRFLAWSKVLFGVLMIPVDLSSGMPLYWTLVEGPFILAWSLALLWLTSATLEDDASAEPPVPSGARRG